MRLPRRTLPRMNTSIRAKKHVFALDCPDAAALGDFYAKLLGWRVRVSDDGEWASVTPEEGGPVGIGCQQIPGYRAPDWPDGPIPQQAHLDFHVDSIPEASAIAEAAGAVKHSHQPSEEGDFVVFLDPVGHPFCLCQA